MKGDFAFAVLPHPFLTLNLLQHRTCLLSYRQKQVGQINFCTNWTWKNTISTPTIWYAKYSLIQMQLKPLCRGKVTCSWSCCTRHAGRIFVHNPPWILTKLIQASLDVDKNLLYSKDCDLLAFWVVSIQEGWGVRSSGLSGGSWVVRFPPNLLSR